MIFVSHSIRSNEKFCEKILWFEYGWLKDYGPIEEVIPKYEAFLKQYKKMTRKKECLQKDAMQRQRKALVAPI